MNTSARSDNKATRKGLAHLGAGRVADAERLFRSVLKAAPQDAGANHGLGMVSVRRGKPRDALALLTAALQANPNEGQYWFSFAEALLLTGATGDARAILDKALSRGLSGPEANALRVRIGHAEALQQAVEHQKSGRLLEARQIFERILAEDPDHVDALHMMGVLAIQEGRPETAVELITRAIAMNDSVAAFHGNLGSALAALKRRDEAILSFQRAIGLDPGDLDARNNLANVLMDHSLPEAALAQHRENIRLSPDNANAHNNLGNFFKKSGEMAKAAECYDQALALDPCFALAHNNMGTLLRDMGRTAEAIECYERAIGFNPAFAEAHYNLGTVLLGKGQLDDAQRHFERATELKPDFADPWINLGNLHKDGGRLDAAIACYDKLIELGVDAAKANNNIGAIHLDQRKIPEAIGRLSEALRLDPQLAEASNNLGNAVTDTGDVEQAQRLYRQALDIKPDYAEAMSNLAGNLKSQGRNAEAIEYYRAAVALVPHLVSAHNNLIMILGYTDVPHQAVVDQARLFDSEIAVPLLRHRRFGNAVDPGRRLRIGYVSGDFRSHAVNYFFEPLLMHHDASAVELFAYSTTLEEDAVTARLKPRFDHWRNIRHLSDDAAADLIEADGIDILIDMSGHMAANRLLVFARKPAPIQATWLGFTTTTGLSAIDYRITDPYTDPVGMTEHFNIEALWRLPATFCCYQPRTDIPAPIDHPPSDDNGFVTFGCFNNFAKISDRTLRRWAEILMGVPNSRLLLEIIGIDGPTFRSETLARLESLGLPLDRVILEPRKRANQYVLYDRVDIALDPFPFNGGTTSLDALWMGVPVIALAGEYFTGRMGVSILNNIGLSELVAKDETDYVARATRLAADVSKRRSLRTSLRPTMAASPMMDFPRFARDIEAAYRAMWHVWCAKQAPDGA
jgi:protein O-GlcNAc transferase